MEDKLTKAVTAAEAKTRLADCLRDVEQGGQVVFTRYGRPMAVLVGPGDLRRLKRLRPASPSDGFAGLVGMFEDGPDLAAELDALVAERSVGRELDLPAYLPE